jgi:hypothetical protein
MSLIFPEKEFSSPTFFGAKVRSGDLLDWLLKRVDGESMNGIVKFMIGWL